MDAIKTLGFAIAVMVGCALAVAPVVWLGATAVSAVSAVTGMSATSSAIAFAFLWFAALIVVCVFFAGCKEREQ